MTIIVDENFQCRPSLAWTLVSSNWDCTNQYQKCSESVRRPQLLFHPTLVTNQFHTQSLCHVKLILAIVAVYFYSQGVFVSGCCYAVFVPPRKEELHSS